MKFVNDKLKKAHRGTELPTHAYHPNISLRVYKRTGYVAMPPQRQQAE